MVRRGTRPFHEDAGGSPGGGSPAAATVNESWRLLCGHVRDCSDGYAATDPRNGWRYRQDADRFCDRLAPTSDDGLFERHAEAAALRERWGALVVAGPLSREI